MKKYLFIICLFVIVKSQAAKRTLNNNNPSPGQYTTWASVQNASSPNDTIYVSGSSVAYGNIYIDKYGLTLIGTGYNPQKQNPLISQFDTISGASGLIRLDGIKCNALDIDMVILGIPVPGQIDLHVSNSYINKLHAHAYSTSDVRLFLTNNIIGNSTNGIEIQIENGVLRGSILNNIIHGSMNINKGYASTYLVILEDFDVNHNIFLNDPLSSLMLFWNEVSYIKGTFDNNILIYYGLSHIESSIINVPVTCKNNIAYPISSTLNLPNNATILFQDPQFVNYCPAFTCGYSPAYDFHLSPTSPGKNLATDGSDVGIYGGIHGVTFNNTGEPHIPQVKEMNMPTTIFEGQFLTTQIISTVK